VITAVFDCSVVTAGLGWKGNPRFCLDLVYCGQVRLCVTIVIWQEYTQTIPRILSEHQPAVDVQRELARLLKLCNFVEPAPLGKQRSRDEKDDPYLAAALGVNADALVSSDRDLLSLGRPFGIHILSPIEFIKFARSEI
jgi:putative PIN family toxin of toxin-antitoxin system